MPFFSVIIPVYNKENYLQETLTSVLGQTFTDFELILVNDGSTDQSPEIISGFQDNRIRLHHQENQGAAAARNTGIQLATGNYLAFLDADDIWYPDFLETFSKLISEVPNEKVFSGAIEVETNGNCFKAEYAITKTNEFEIVIFFEASLKESVLWTSSTVFEKSVFKDNVGMFDITLTNFEDIDLWIRVGLKYKVVFTWKTVARYVYDENSLSRNKSATANAGFLNKYVELEKNNPALNKYLDYNRFSIAVKYKLNGDFTNYKMMLNSINQKNLPLRKRIILHLPKTILKRLILIKLNLTKWGLSSSVFK